jgi:hypothetical protein
MGPINFHGKYSPKYRGNTRLSFSYDEVIEALELLKNKVKLNKIAAKFKTSSKIILAMEELYNKSAGTLKRNIISNTKFGNRNDTYITEEFLLNSPKYSWESLNANEKYFYLNYGKRKYNKRCNLND